MLRLKQLHKNFLECGGVYHQFFFEIIGFQFQAGVFDDDMVGKYILLPATSG